MRSTRRKKEAGTRERGTERVRETGVRGRGKAARSQGGLFGDRRRRRAKNEQNGSEREPDSSSAFALPCPTRLTSPRLSSSSSFASPRLCLPARHETANTPELKLRSHANAAARLHRLLGSSSFFLPSLTRTPLRPSLRRRLLSPLRSRLSLPRSLAREPFRSPAGSSPRPNARANVPVPTI